MKASITGGALVVARFCLGACLFVSELAFVGFNLLDGLLHEAEVRHELRKRKE